MLVVTIQYGIEHEEYCAYCFSSHYGAIANVVLRRLYLQGQATFTVTMGDPGTLIVRATEDTTRAGKATAQAILTIVGTGGDPGLRLLTEHGMINGGNY